MTRAAFDIAPNLIADPSTLTWTVFDPATRTATPDGAQWQHPGGNFARSLGNVTVPGVTAGTSYLFKVRYRRNSGTNRLQIHINDATGATAFEGVAPDTPTGQWGEYSAVFTSPTDSAVAWVQTYDTTTPFDFTISEFDLYDQSLLGCPLPDVIRLEVEQDPEGLKNLIENPSGELGAWGYVTPVPGSVLVSENSPVTDYRPGLKYTTAATSDPAGNYFSTEAVPVAAGQYLAASWHVGYAPYDFYRAKFRWLTATKTTISDTGWQNFTGSYVDAFRAPVLAPANTAYAQVIWEVGGGGSDGNTPTYPYTVGGSRFGVSNVTMAAAADSADLGTIRTNIVPNPSFEVDTTGWSAGGHTSAISRVAAAGVGSYALQATVPASIEAGQSSYVNSDSITGLRAGRNYAFTCRINPQGNAADFTGRMRVLWYDPAGNEVRVDYGPRFTLTDNAFTTVTALFAAPAGATQMRVSPSVIVATTSTTSRTWLLDAVLAEMADQIGDYFDGTTPAADGWTYAWIGTPHNSSSRASNANLSYIEPIEWFDIMGDSHDISIVREDLNVGTITATVVNPDLDPSVADTLRPGRQYRFTGFNPDTSAFEPLIRGKISNAKVDYLPLNDEPHRARITMTGADNIAPLAASKRSTQVGSIGDLPFVLEGCGVPWNVNGSGNQVPSATAVVTNDNASALDVISVARDTALGYAWVDRYGVLQAWDASLMPAGDPPLLDESVYNPNLALDFDTDSCMNSISITRQWSKADGSSVDGTYGPYNDNDSIAKWGLHPAQFTVAGIDEAEVAGYADQILAANSQPTVRVESLEVPITSTDQLRYGFLDLYDLVRVVNTDSGIDQLLRVTSIAHALEADDEGGKWKVTLGFDAEGAVAAPYQTPPATSQAVAVDPYLFMRKNNTDMALTAATWTEVQGWDITTLQGLDQIYSRVTIQAPGLYLVQFNVAFTPDTSRCLGAITLNDTQGGAPLARFDVTPAGSDRVAENLCVPVWCNAGDVLRGLVYVAAATRSVAASLATMSVARIK